MLTKGYINSCDIDEAIQELEEAQEALNEATNPQEYMDAQLWTEPEELKELIEFRNALKPYAPDWDYGVTLIHESCFIEYAKEFVEDPVEHWPYNHIDWEAAAEELKVDYTEHEGYYVR